MVPPLVATNMVEIISSEKNLTHRIFSFNDIFVSIHHVQNFAVKIKIETYIIIIYVHRYKSKVLANIRNFNWQ